MEDNEFLFKFHSRIIDQIGRMNEHKRKLLRQQNAYPQINEEWIMLQEMNPSKQTPKNPYEAVIHPPKYYKLQEHPISHPISHHNHNKIEQLPKQTPFNSKVITINGQTFKQVQKNKPNAQVPPKKPKLPQMHVSCYYCSTLQSVPGTAEQFKCCNCTQHNICVPIYKIFKCGTCLVKVCYAVTTSNMIRCTKCGTVNKVPEKTSNYQAEIKIPSSLERQEFNTEYQDYVSIREADRSQFGEQFELQSQVNRRL